MSDDARPDVDASPDAAPASADAKATSPLPYADPSTPHAARLVGSAALTRRDGATIIIRLIGLLVLVQAIGPLLWLIQPLFGRPSISGGTLIFYLVALALYLGLAAVLLMYGEWIGGMLLPGPVEPERARATPPMPLSARDIQAAAFAVVGILLIVAWAVPGIVLDGWRWMARTRTTDEDPTSQIFPFLGRHFVELALGLWLFFGSKRLASYWQSVRGVDSMPRPHDEDGPL